jgi:hypothetical protein
MNHILSELRKKEIIYATIEPLLLNSDVLTLTFLCLDRVSEALGGTVEVNTAFWWENFKKRDHLKDLDKNKIQLQEVRWRGGGG